MSKSVNKRDLIDAVREGNWPETKAFLDNGADPDETDMFLDIPATEWAAASGNAEIVRLLIDRGATNWHDALQVAAVHGHIEIMKLLLDRGENIDRQDYSGNTALHKAAGGRQVEAVRFLLERGARADIRNNYVGGVKAPPGEGSTALSHCRNAGKWMTLDESRNFVTCDTKENKEIIKLLEAVEAAQKRKTQPRRASGPAGP
jgi:ankyrin repeat protein